MRRRWLTALIIGATLAGCSHTRPVAQVDPPTPPVAQVHTRPVAQVDPPTPPVAQVHTRPVAQVAWTGESDRERDRRERLAERVREAERAARAAERTPPPASTLPSGLVTVRDHESSGDYTAYNPTGCSDENGTWSCGGAFQLSEQYASEWAARSGFGGMSSQAQIWPPAIQDAVAIDLWYASNPDGWMWCNFTTYC